MITKVKVRDIEPNPYQARKAYDRESIQSLAAEIKTVGLWPGALRGRRHNGKVQLCFGHRRLDAIKLLKWQEVDVDIVDLSDDEMATQSLIENLQREGLNDVDKAEGIVALVKQLKKSKGHDEAQAIQEIAHKMGLSVPWTKDLMRISTFDDSAKQEIRKGRIAGRTALEANRIGGMEMIKVAAEKKLPVHTLTSIGKKISEIPDAEVRERIKKKVLKGEVTSPDEIQRKARELGGRRQKNLPPDLIIVFSRWTEEIKKWNAQLDAVFPYLEYLDSQPKIAEEFRSAVRELIGRLQKFV